VAAFALGGKETSKNNASTVEPLAAPDELDAVGGGTVIAGPAGAGAVVVGCKVAEFTGRGHSEENKKIISFYHQIIGVGG